MATATIDRINRLTNERARLYSVAMGGRPKKQNVHERISVLTSELDSLWEQRRIERVGHSEGIDLLVEQSYKQVYGSNVNDVVAPPSLAEAVDEVVVTLAA